MLLREEGGGGAWAWHKVKAIVDFICGFIIITNMDWESICHWIFQGDNIRSHNPEAIAQKSSEGKAFMIPEHRDLSPS